MKIIKIKYYNKQINISKKFIIEAKLKKKTKKE